MTGVEKCPEACQTRWFTYSRGAFWILKYWAPLHTAIMTNVGSYATLKDSFKLLVDWMADHKLLLQLNIIAEFGEHSFGTRVSVGDAR